MSTQIRQPYSSQMAVSVPSPGLSMKVSPQPKFGSAASSLKASANNFSLATSARALTMSEKIVETFLWGFVGLDVFGMWVPRIKVSLTRGAIPYDVRQDPEMKDKPLPEQVWKSTRENLKGLNWTNLYEEAGREFATGPGMLVVPTLVYLGVNRAMGGQAIRLTTKNLTEHGSAFSKHLRPTAQSDILNQSQFASVNERHAFLKSYRHQVKNYLVDIFKDDEFYKFNTTAALKEYRASLPVNKQKKLNALLPLDKVGNGKQYLDQWFHLWTERHVHQGQASGKVTRWGREEMAPAYQELHDILVDKFNEHHALAKTLDQLHQGKLTGSTGIMKSSDVTILGQKNSLSGFIGSGSTQGELEKLGGYFSSIAGERLAGKSGHIADMAVGVMQKAGGLKVIQYAAALLSAAYVATLVKFTQKHDAYPGERLAHLEKKDDKATHREKHDLKEHQQISRLAYTPPVFRAEQASPFKLSNKEAAV